MDKEKLVKQIIDDAKKEQEEMLEKINLKIEEDKKKNKSELEDYRNRKISEIKNKTNQIKENAISKAELEARNMILGVKQKVILDTKNKINEIIFNLNGIEYVNFIMKILRDMKLIELEDAQIILPIKQREEIAKLINNKLTVVEENEAFYSGFIVKKDNVEYNFVLDNILEMEEELYNKIIIENLISE